MTEHEVQRLTFNILMSGGICSICDQVVDKDSGTSAHQSAYDHAYGCLKDDEESKYAQPKTS